MSEAENISVSTRVTKIMYDAITEKLNSSGHLNVSDYLRDLIRKDLDNAKEKDPKR